MLKAIKILAILLIAGTSVFAQPGQSRKHKNVKKQVEEHLEYEEFQQAIPLLQQLLEADAGSAYYNFWMGKSLYVTYQRNRALPFLEKVERINPDVDPEFHFYYALTLHYNLEFDRAIKEYRTDLQRHEPGSDSYNYISNRISQAMFAKTEIRKTEGEQVKIKNLGDKINTPYAEHSPVISANDSVLIFTARRPESLGAHPEQNYYDEDVYISRRTENGWSEARNIGTPVNSKGHDATISLNAEGDRLYIYRHKKNGGLYVTDFDEAEQKWKEPRAIERPLNSKYYEASIAQSADGNTLFFTSDRPGGYGGRDIYMVKKEGNDWGEPVNLGGNINTPFDEDAPYFHPDGKTLYYSSNGPRSVGGFDIFVTRWDTATGNWEQSLNMGFPINTPDDDIYFVLTADGLNGYYSSGKEGGFGEKDIYQVRFPYYPYPRRFFMVEIAGLVQDVNTLDTLDALVLLTDAETNEVLDSIRTGRGDSTQFYFVLEPERAYSIRAIAEGYPEAMEIVTPPVPEDEDILIEKVLFMGQPTVVVVEEPKVEPQMPAVQHIYFDFDKSDLRDEAREELDRVASILKENEDFNLEILGHTDWYGNYDYNVRLSRKRSEAALAYLRKQGVDVSRVKIDYLSENRPMTENESDEGRQYNRRSEFRFTRDGEVVIGSQKLRPGGMVPPVDHTQPKGQPGYDNPNGLSLPAEDGMAVNDRVTAFEAAYDKDAIKDETRSGGKDELKDETRTEESGKDELKSGSSDNEGSDDGETETVNAGALEGVTVHHIYFDFDRSNIRGEAETELNDLVRLLKAHPELSVEVYGHTDSHGSVSYNQALSDRRSQAAMGYILGEGIDESRVSITGFSELKPADDNDTSNGRQNNRRVEFRIIRDGNVVIKSIP